MSTFQKKLTGFNIVIALLFLSLIGKAQSDPVYVEMLRGDSIKTGKTIIVKDTVFFNPQINPPVTSTSAVQNIISLRINEYSDRMLPDSFVVSVKVRINFIEKNGLADSIVEKTLTLDYNKNKAYKDKAIFTFNNAYWVQLKVLDITAQYAPTAAILPVLDLENRLIINRDYAVNCVNDAVKTISRDESTVPEYGELRVYWPPNRVSEEYDLEWTFVDKSALENGRYHKDGQLNAELIFKNNATRVTTKNGQYMVPLLYDGEGSLFFRVRGVQTKVSGEVLTTNWSSDFIAQGGLGRYEFTGHERNLNWQATTSFAEEGKRKSVVQYFDGSLKNRQTVTRDNTTQTTVVAETLYDKQGRPAIQVMPAPTISKLIGYTPGFNVVDVNSREYDQGVYDTLTNAYCEAGAPAMSQVKGAAQYYSPLNPKADSGYHRFIPNANGYAFAQTQYTQDNTGRIYRQGGVGEQFQVGSNHETRYYYLTPDQSELDALFGTEAGDYTHYQKNMVRDANGQYSVSYVDMHGRTIATALAGESPAALDTLSSFQRLSYQSQQVLNPVNNIIKDGNIEFSKTLVMTRNDSVWLHYSLGKQSLTLQECQQRNICYDCLYDLSITIAGDCQNQVSGETVKHISIRNFPAFTVDTVCSLATPVDTVIRTFLQEGSYTITKVLSLSKAGMDYLRDSVYLLRNTCKSYQDIFNEQIQIAAATASCMQGTVNRSAYLSYRDQMLLDLTPLIGQYADTAINDATNTNCFSIFDKVGDGYRYQTIAESFLNDEGQADMVANSEGILVRPQELTPGEFISNYKDSWTPTLLPLHPEYSLLTAFEKFRESLEWDDDFTNTDSYQEAYSKGYLNPSGSTRLPASRFPVNVKDPLFTYALGNAQMAVEDSLFYFRSGTGDAQNPYLTAWGLATGSAKCVNASDKNCTLQWNQAQNVFNTGLLCQGELDMAWRTFRSIYMEKKREWIFQYIHQQTGLSYPVNTCDQVFEDKAHILSNEGYFGIGQQDSILGRNKAASYYASNCETYQSYWRERLSSCYDAAQTETIINYLTEVCKQGADEQHPFGSSTVRSGSTYPFSSFDAVVQHVNDSLGRQSDIQCNAYLLEKPLPYQQSQVLVQKPLWSKPDSCSCTKINSLYSLYSAESTRYTSFSDYMQKRQGTAISNASLDSLRRLCNGEITCNYISNVIYLPPALQCGVENVCATCTEFQQAYDSFKVKFPNAIPSDSLESEDSLQLQVNQVFTTYMNQRFGFQKSVFEYLDFLDSCKGYSGSAGGISTLYADTLRQLLLNFRPYYKSIKDSVNTGLIFKNYRITKAAWTLLDAVNAILSGKHNLNNLPVGYGFATDTRNFDAKLRSVINRSGRYHVIVPLPLNYTLPGLAGLNGLRNNIVDTSDFVIGPVTKEQLNMRYYATVLFDAGQSFQQIWSSKYYGSYSYYGVATPLLKYLPDQGQTSENHVYQLSFSSSASVNSPLSNANITRVRDLRFAPEQYPFGDNFSARGVKATVDMISGSSSDVYLFANYGYPYLQFKETIDTNLYSPDCKKAFLAYFNWQSGKRYTSLQVDSIFNVNKVPLVYCNNEASCNRITVPSSGAALPFNCEQLINTYKNFQADFPDPSKGAVVKVLVNQPAAFSILSANQMVATSGEQTHQVAIALSTTVADTTASVMNNPSESQTLAAAAVPGVWVDSLLKCKQLFEWYFNYHLYTSGYTYENFTDWLANGCGYKMVQLPCSDSICVPCDTLQKVKDMFEQRYPASIGNTITETISIPVHKVTHIKQWRQTNGVIYSEATFSSVGALSAINAPSDGYIVFYRDNIGFDFRSLAPNAVINDAKFNLFSKPDLIDVGWACSCAAHYRRANDPAKNAFMEKLTDWVVPRTTLWSTQPSTDTSNRLTLNPISVRLPNVGNSSDFYSNEDYLNQSCTPLVRDLHAAAWQNRNYGLLFRINSETVDLAHWGSYIFWDNSPIAPVAKRPYLSVNYTASRCDVFTAFVNTQLGTHLTTEQVQALYADKCGVIETPCGITPPIPSTYNGPLLCGKNEPLNEIVSDLQSEPCADSTIFATFNAVELHRIYRDSLIGNFNESYTRKCLSAASLESLTITRPVSEYHYTLYYYDLAGNLVKTVSPEGVHPNRDPQWLQQVAQKRASKQWQAPSHSMVTVYRYNSLNQVVSQITPDAGKSQFWYDRLGRLALSQNAKQKLQSNYSYTRYDTLGRVIEVGEKYQTTPVSQSLTRSPLKLRWWLDYNKASGNQFMPRQVTYTVYDAQSSFVEYWRDLTCFSQKLYTLRNRVSSVRYFDEMHYWVSIFNGDTLYTPKDNYVVSAVDYSYDIHGNVDALLNIYGETSPMAAHGANLFKQVNYKYDLISGKVNEVHYQKCSPDAYFHRYEYDADNRLTGVYTTDNLALLHQSGLEDQEAHYSYYKHGPLARTVLGQQQVQGLDYAYTLQGWLKGVNSTALNTSYDMGEDGRTASFNQWVGRDVFGFNLNYYSGDYGAIKQGLIPFPGHSGSLPSGAYRPLYNGNISSMAVSIGALNQSQLYNYRYDQLNRLVAMDVYRGLNETNNTWKQPLLDNPGDYKERVSYDGNGNILKYLRQGYGSKLPMDSLTYQYNAGTNQLNYVRDRIGNATTHSSNYSVDLEDQNANNYSYDAIGNLVKDTKEGISSIEWTVYGKIKRITKSDGTTITYTYDPSGNRIGKQAGGTTTWYVRDAQGNVLAVYESLGSSLRLKEQHLYGSSRLGIVQMGRDMDLPYQVTPVYVNLLGATYAYNVQRGQKLYELSNHLGNVLASISDRKIAVPSQSNSSLIGYYKADVVSAQDYYPFGMQMPGRTVASGAYRYGFNGKENDNEVKGEGNQQDYGMRIYDPRAGRFLSVDPITANYPMLTPYQFASNRPIDGIDEDGLEWAPSQKGDYVWKGYNKDGSVAPNTVPTASIRIGNDRYDFTSSPKMRTGSIHITHADGSTRDIIIQNASTASFIDREKPVDENSNKLSEVLGKFRQGGIKPVNYSLKSYVGASGSEINSHISSLGSGFEPGTVNAIYPEAALVPLPKIGLLAKGAGKMLGFQAKVAAEEIEKAIVIGEGMDRVKSAARSVGAKWYQAWSKNFPSGRLMTEEELSAAKLRNARWLNSKIKQGYKIYDIGPRGTNVLSPFYQLERDIIQKTGYSTTPLLGY